MKKDLIFSDPHLGTSRQAHTTRDSASRLQYDLFLQAMAVARNHNGRRLMLGDLFDKAFNSEQVLVQGYQVANECNLVISGNHDETNRESATTTLRALEAMGAPVIASPDLSDPHFEAYSDNYWVVPHHASQELFEQALRQAVAHAAGQDEERHKYLLLHCNYNVPFDTEDSTLNLTPEMAEHLLDVFSRIFIGHEHNPKTFHDDRLVLVGNTHPTSFSDISDKFAWYLDPASDELERKIIWDKAEKYAEIQFGEAIPNLDGVQFVDVIGSEPVEDAVEVAQFVRSVWDEYPDLRAVRNNVEIIDHLRNTSGVDTTKSALVDLRARIHDDLEGSDLQPEFNRLVSRAQGANA